jgi:hypothetical protein
MLFFCSALANSLVDASIARPRSTCSSRHSKGEQENLANLIMLGTAFITGVLFEGSPSRSLQMLMFGYLVHEDVISEQKLKSERTSTNTNMFRGFTFLRETAPDWKKILDHLEKENRLLGVGLFSCFSFGRVVLR